MPIVITRKVLISDAEIDSPKSKTKRQRLLREVIFCEEIKPADAVAAARRLLSAPSPGGEMAAPSTIHDGPDLVSIL